MWPEIAGKWLYGGNRGQFFAPAPNARTIYPSRLHKKTSFPAKSIDEFKCELRIRTVNSRSQWNIDVETAVESTMHVRYVDNSLRGEGGFNHDVYKSRHGLESSLMFAPRVFISMIGALAVFAFTTFILTGSAWTTMWQTLLCAVLLQAGYFIAILIMVAREGHHRRKQAQGQVAVSASTSDEKEAKTIHVPINPGHFNS